MKLKTMLMGATAAALCATAASAERGADGQLNILYWQAVSIMNPFLSNGTKDVHASSLVLEPLARYDETGNLVPFLAEEIPTAENGGISEDLTQITWRLKEGLLWSDGTPVTADDAVHTWQYCTDPGTGCSFAANFTDVASVEAGADPNEIVVTFTKPTPFPFGPFVSAESPILQKAQFADCLGARAAECTDANFMPIGTGPFVVTEFRPNDVVLLEANPNFRDPEKPAFGTVQLKGGGDAAASARAVLETGEFDYGWNLQIEPEVLEQMSAAGQGEVISAFGTLVERIHANPYGVDPSLGDVRSTEEAGPHPFLSDPNVVRAMSLAIDRTILDELGYGESGQPTCNAVANPPDFVSTGVDWCLTPNVEEANRLLDEAGWTMGADGVRAKDGVRMSLLFQTSTNSVRQGQQALIKQMWEAIGIETELRNIDAAVFFGGDPASPDTLQKFYADVQMYANNFTGADPASYLGGWTCDEIPSPETGWVGANDARFCNEEYDAMAAELAETAGIEERAAIATRMNDLLVENGGITPLIHRGDVSARSLTLGGVRMNAFDSQLWNAADWFREE